MATVGPHASSDPAPAGTGVVGLDLPGPALPVDAVLGPLLAALTGAGRAVLAAPPGAGKTTRVPLALLARDRREERHGRIVVLEPRRVAARAAALRMATQLGEPLGHRVGLTTRDERRRSRATRIEVVTEGVLLRRLQQDPSLPGVGVVIFDEFHERNLEADLALAFALETRAALRDDLELLVASATLEVDRVADLLGGAPVLTAEGRRHEVAVEHRARPRPGRLAEQVVDAVLDALAAGDGDVLVFLPGAREIRDVARSLSAVTDPARILVRPLHGALSAADQDAALAPAVPGTRKVVLSTDLAESSVTIEGVRTVVDAGLSREPRYDPTTGLSGLVTVPASRASAEQRAGRAGRTAPGRCIRLWPEREHAARDAAPRPAIATDDLTAAALEVATWGAEVAELALLDQPPPAAWSAAGQVLRDLGALDAAGRPTPHGRALARLPLHPRLGHLLLLAAASGVAELGADLAAVLADRDLLTTGPEAPDADLASRLQVLRGGPVPTGSRLRRGALARARRERDRLSSLVAEVAVTGPALGAGALVLSAWPQQLAAARPDRRGGYLLASGRGAELAPADPLAGEAWLAVAHLDRGHRTARIHLAAALDLAEVRAVLAERRTEEREVAWRDGDVVAERREQVGAVVLERARLHAPDADLVLAALLDGLRREGLGLLDVRDEDRQLQARAGLVRRVLGPDWPPLDDRDLLEDAEELLGPFLLSIRNRAELSRVRLGTVLAARLGPQRLQQLDRLAPTHLEVASGSRRRLDYTPGDRPVLAARVQELFGATTTPTVVDGRVSVLLHLLSPAGRPVQVTDDLAGFWERGYPQVRAELRGRYPKHAWPEDPLTARALRGTPRRR